MLISIVVFLSSLTIILGVTLFFILKESLKMLDWVIGSLILLGVALFLYFYI